MPLRLLLLVLLVASAAGVSLFAASPAEARRSPACSSQGSKTVYASRSGRIFSRRVHSGRRRYTLRYSCSFAIRRKFRLAVSDFLGEDDYGPYRIAGGHAAYGFYPSCGACENRIGYVMVQNLRTGKHRYRPQAGGTPDDGTQNENVTDLELRRSGSVAWIVQISVFTAPGVATKTYEVHKQEPSGRTPLDAGPDVDPRSLRLSGSTVSWTRAGAPRSATLQ